MDVNGRLHMPGFVGETFEETGVAKEVAFRDLQPRGNRKERRAQEAIDRLNRKVKASTDSAA